MFTIAEIDMAMIKGRGTDHNPPNRYESIFVEYDDIEAPRTQFFTDHSKTILAKNNSPDVGFDYSLNPYRGCEHGCIYCYARPTHEQLGFSAGLDFESKIMIKRDAPVLLEKIFRSRAWRPQVVALSGNTDCYQPVERRLQLTRACLRVFLQYRNPVSIITKNALVLRDIDLLSDLANHQLVHVHISITTLDHHLCRILEPRTSSPRRRLEAIARLAQAGVPVGVMVAPVIPGLNDRDIPAILREAARAGAENAGYILLRLPYGLKDLFVQWLRKQVPQKADKVIHQIQSMREGELYQCEFGTRKRGRGPTAQMIQRLFELSCSRHGLKLRPAPLRTDLFRHAPEQIQLDFGGAGAD